jgi:hypothetical protein
VPDKLKIATRILSNAPTWVVESVAWGLVVALPALGLFGIQQYVKAEKAETEKRLLREHIEDLKTTLGAERSAAYWASNKP